MTSDEYDKMISDNIEQELIDHENMNNIPTDVILRHLLGRCDGYTNDELLLGKYNNFIDCNGDRYRFLIIKD